MEKNYSHQTLQHRFKVLMKAALLPLAFIVSSRAIELHAQTTSWIGGTNSEWRESSNWTNGVPTSSLNANIGDASFTGGYQPILYGRAGKGQCKSLTLGNGAKASTLDVNDRLEISGNLIIGANGTLNDNSSLFTISGDWMNSGSYVTNSILRQVNFTGSATQTIGGSSVTNFSEIIITTGSSVVLAQNIQIDRFLRLKGTFDPENFTVSGPGDVQLRRGADLKVKAATFTANYSHTGTVSSNNNDVIIDYAASTINQSVDPAIDYRDLRISGSMTKTLAGNLSIRSDLFLDSGTLDLSTFTADRNSAGGEIVLGSGAILRIGGTNTFPNNYNNHVLATTSTVEYSGSNQVVTNEDYGNLTLSTSSGAVVKTMPSTVMNIRNNMQCSVSSGSLSFTAGASINVLGSISIGANCIFDGATYTHSFAEDWTNEGTYNGNSSTFSSTGASSYWSGVGVNNFGTLDVTGNGTIIDQNSAFNVNGNLTTAGGGTLTHVSGGSGTLSMTGTTASITGTNMILDDVIVASGSSVTTSSSIVLQGDLTVDGSLTAGAGTVSMIGASKSISGSGSVQFAALNIPGNISTARDLNISGNLSVAGALTANAGQVTFNGTSTLSGDVNLFDVIISNANSLALGADSRMGISGVGTLQAGATFDITTHIPNTVDFNGSGAQTIDFNNFHHLTVSNGSTKTPTAGLTINGNLSIGSSTTLDGGVFTHDLKGNWSNSGTFSANTSTVWFSGNNEVTFAGATTFNNVVVNKGSQSNLSLLDDLTVADLTMTAGTILTGSSSVTITSDRTGNGLIIGTISRNHAFITTTDYAFEGPDNTINFSSITGAITSITVVVDQAQVAGFPSGDAVNRWYDITVSGGIAYTASLRLHYEESELNGNNEATLTLWNDLGVGSWTDLSKNSSNAASNWVEQGTLTDLENKWTLSEGSTAFSWDGSTNSDWNEPTNWSTGSVPQSADVAKIGDLSFTNQPVIATTVEVKRLVFGSVTASTLTISSGSLTVQGNVDGEWLSDATHTINVGSNTLNVNSDLMLSDGVVNRSIDLSVSSGSVNVLGDLVQSGGADILFISAGNLNLAGDFNCESGTFSAPSSTVCYNGAGDQEVAAVNYNKLNIAKATGVATVKENTNVTSDLEVTSGGQFNLSANLTVGGSVNIGSGSILSVSSDTLRVGGDWIVDGTFNPGTGTMIFNEGNDQSMAGTTFHNIVVDKSGGTLTLLGDLNVSGDIKVLDGTVDVKTYDVTRTTTGGSATLGNGATAIFSGSTVQMSNFAALVTGATSTVIYNGTTTRVIPPITFGNLVISNGGSNAKIMVGPTVVLGDLTVDAGATLNAPSSTLSLAGDFTINGTFNCGTGTIVYNGTNKAINGTVTYHDVVVNGSYDIQSGDATFGGHIQVSPGGDFDLGSATVVSDGDLTNEGILVSSGNVTFNGTQEQTFRLINAITSTSTGVVNFNGNVAPVMASNSSPNFATVNINNTAVVKPSQPWNVFVAMNIASGSTFDAGPSVHTFYGSFNNDGVVTSSGTLKFNPVSDATIDLGVNFSSTGIVEFGGSSVITLLNDGQVYDNLFVSNSNVAGLTPTSDWAISGDLLIGSGAILNGGSFNHTISGAWTNNGTFNGQTSTIILDNVDTESDMNGNGTYFINNLTFASSSDITMETDISISGNFTNNSTSSDLTSGKISFAGLSLSVIGGSTNTTFQDLEINKSSSGVRMDLTTTIAGVLDLEDGQLDLNGNTLSITNSDASAITRTNGYILSERTDNGSLVQWVVGPDQGEHIFAFGNSSGAFVPVKFQLTSGDAGTVSVATYPTAINNTPYPAGVTHMNYRDVDISDDVVDRFFQIDLVGENSPVVTLTLTASAVEVGGISNLLGQRWNGNDWEQPLPGQSRTGTSVTIPGVTSFSPWTMSGNSMILPVELIDFYGVSQSGRVDLVWETATERNNDRFEVYRTLPGKDFELIGEVEGGGNSDQPLTYEFNDYDVSPGTIYYRLKQIDFDGEFEYSNTIQVTYLELGQKSVLYPNPVVNGRDVSLNLEGFYDQVEVDLYDLNGELIVSRHFEIKPGDFRYSLEWSESTPRGIYVVTIKSASRVHSERLIVE